MNNMNTAQLNMYRDGILNLIDDTERGHDRATTDSLLAYYRARIGHLLDELGRVEARLAVKRITLSAAPRSLEEAQYMHDMKRVGEW